MAAKLKLRFLPGAKRHTVWCGVIFGKDGVSRRGYHPLVCKRVLKSSNGRKTLELVPDAVVPVPVEAIQAEAEALPPPPFTVSVHDRTDEAEAEAVEAEAEAPPMERPFRRMPVSVRRR